MRKTAAAAIFALAAFGALDLSGARADTAAYPMDFQTCLGMLAKAAVQINVPLTFSVNTPQRKDFVIATTGGTITLSCDATRQVLSVFTPPGVDFTPYVSTQ